MRLLLAVAAALSLLPAPARACTAFLTGSTVGKCYDWHMGQGLLVVNPHGLAKEALRLSPDEHPARWTAAHASLTFNQYGRELPNGGINDAGLVVEVLWLDTTRLPPPDARPTINNLQWIQYQLDRFATVDEMAAHADELRITSPEGKVHYFACDAHRACATFELLDGKLVVTRDLRAITNDTAAASRARLARPPGRTTGSLDRVARATSLAKAGRPADEILTSVENGDSQWRITYDLETRRVTWRTRAHPSPRSVDAARLLAGAGCSRPAHALDLDTPATGDLTDRVAAADYTEAADRALVERSTAGMHLPPGTAAALAHYPSALACTEPPHAPPPR